MSKTALFIKQQALPGKRDEVRRVWEKYLRPSIISNTAHETYVYCYDDDDPDTICVFQLYASQVSSQEFLKAPWYAAYRKEVAPFLAGEPEIRTATPVWAKGAFI